MQPGDKDIHIAFEDQQKINEFNRLFQSNREIKIELKKLDAIRQKMIDSKEELELSSDPDVLYSFADCFIRTPIDKAIEFNDKRQADIEAEIKSKGEIRSVNNRRIDALRVELKAKLGDAVALEE